MEPMLFEGVSYTLLRDGAVEIHVPTTVLHSGGND